MKSLFLKLNRFIIVAILIFLTLLLSTSCKASENSQELNTPSKTNFVQPKPINSFSELFQSTEIFLGTPKNTIVQNLGGPIKDAEFGDYYNLSLADINILGNIPAQSQKLILEYIYSEGLKASELNYRFAFDQPKDYSAELMEKVTALCGVEPFEFKRFDSDTNKSFALYSSQEYNCDIELVFAYYDAELYKNNLENSPLPVSPDVSPNNLLKPKIYATANIIFRRLGYFNDIQTIIDSAENIENSEDYESIDELEENNLPETTGSILNSAYRAQETPVISGN